MDVENKTEWRLNYDIKIAESVEYISITSEQPLEAVEARAANALATEMLGYIKETNRTRKKLED